MQIFTLLAFVIAIPALSQESKPSACQQVAAIPLPAEASVSTPVRSPACESYKSYAGIDRPTDYTAARDCAWKERIAQQAGLGQNPKAPIAWVVGGSLILADLYANGLGVPRNLPLAMRLTCEQTGSFLDGAISDLEFRRTNGLKAAEHFELCDYAASTFEMNFCAAFSSEQADELRGRTVRNMAKDWTSSQKSAFASAKKAYDAYITVVGRRETYQGGTIRNLRMEGVEQDLQKDFFSALQSFENGHLPHSSVLEYQKADTELNLVYRKAIAAVKVPKSDAKDEIQPEGIQATERSWLKYRDAWLDFAKLRYPSTDANAWLASLTMVRTERLKLTLCGFLPTDSLCTPSILRRLEALP